MLSSTDPAHHSFDLDLPVECDDEYWEHPDPDKRFVQPEGKLSVATFHIHLLKLREILAFAVRTIVGIFTLGTRRFTQLILLLVLHKENETSLRFSGV